MKQELVGVSTDTNSVALMNGRAAGAASLPDLEILKQMESHKQLKGLIEQL